MLQPAKKVSLDKKQEGTNQFSQASLSIPNQILFVLPPNTLF